MYVLIKPLMDEYDEEEFENQSTLFDMSNDVQYSPNQIISSFLDFNEAKKLMNFGVEPKPEPKPKKVPYKDPNQLELAFESKKFIRTKLSELK